MTSNALRPIEGEETWMGMKVFSGEDRQNFDNFVAQFALRAGGFGWSEEQQAAQLPVLLKGYALQCYKQIALPDQGNFQTVLTHLKARLNPKEQESFYQQQLVDRQQNPNESVTAFAAVVQKLIKGAYPIEKYPGIDDNA